MNRYLLACCLTVCLFSAVAQCPTIQTSDFSFATDGVCAPVTVTGYTATYTLLNAVDPDDITIRFEWNDPAATVDDFTNGAGLMVSGGNTIFEATGTFTYDPSNDCAFVPSVSLRFQGDECTSSTQDVFVWDDDDDFGGVMAIDPNDYDVCFNSAITGAVFTDNSTFNCNPFDNDPGIANRAVRHTQFVYGANHPGNSIRDLTVDGNTVTDGTGALSTPDTRGTAGEMVTAGYFGEIDTVIFPADAPTSISLAIAAPANMSNTVGSTFEVTLFNWNTCNPWNEDAANPNYEDAVRETVTITIVDPPVPGYQAHKDNFAGPVPDPAEFCIGETIYFEDTTQNAGGITYFWEFFDDNTDAGGSIGTSTNANPTFVYNDVTNPQKLVRLTVTNPNVPAACVKVYENFVTISDAPIAGIELRDTNDVIYVTPPDFCQDGSSTFTVEFNDVTTGVDGNTRWRWEFYDGTMTLTESIPAGMGNYSATPITDFTRDFTQEELVTVRLLALNQLTGCETVAETVFGIYSTPDVDFMADEACEGVATLFSGIADETGSLVPRVNNDIVDSYQWDFSYDGVSFNVEDDRPNNDDFSNILGSANTYDVALVMTTAVAQCSDTLVKQVTVNPLPASTFTDSFAGAICPGESIDFTNTSANGPLVVTYDLEISHGPSGDSFDLTDIGNGTSFVFPNPDDSVRTYAVQLEATTDDGCVTFSTTADILVNSDEQSGFDDPTFSFLDPNCSPYSSTLFVDANTVSLNVDQYNWDIIDSNDQTISGFPVSKFSTDPDFHELDYQVANDSSTIRSYKVILEAIKAGVCIANDTFDIVVSPQPDPTYNVIQEDNCEDVVFTVVADKKGLTYDWDFDPVPDDVIDNDDEQILTYQREISSGSDIAVQMTLTVTNLASCQSDPEVQNFVVEKRNTDLTADFSLSADSLRYPDTVVTLTNLSTASVTYEWDFGDGNMSALFGPIDHPFSTTGNFDISLTVSDDHCEENIVRSFVLLPAVPVIDFVADTLQGCAPLTVNFTNLSQSAEPGSYIWQFGDGNFSLDDNASNTYTSEGIYTVSLRGENDIGESATTEKVAYINVFGVPSSNFIADQQDNCEDVTFALQALESGHLYDWSFDPAPDSLVDNGDQPTAIYFRAAVTGADFPVEIALMTKSADSCESATTVQNFTVEKRSEELVADFTLSANSQQYPDTTLSFVNTSTTGVDYLWDFGDGTQSTEQGSFDHSYSEPGNYTINLTVSDTNCDAVASALFSLLPTDPVIDFEADVLEGCTPLTVNFTNLSTSAVAGAYFWEFGDGNISREDNPSHTYVAQGVYTVSLRGENSAGVQAQEVKNDYISIVGTPSSNFIVDKQDNCEDVTFFIQAEQEGLTYDWQFDPVPDIQTGSEDEVVITYNREPLTGPDLFVEITSTISASGNCVGAAVLQRDTVEHRNPEIVAAFTTTEDTLLLPDSTVFLANFSTQGDGIDYHWDFGNGETSDAEGSLVYSYTEPGNYQIFLTVTDEYCQSAATEPIVVFPPDPIINFVADTLEGCAPLTVAFTNLSEHAVPGQFSWDFGDGGISVADNPVYTFFNGGDFSVRLRGRNPVGVTAELERENYISIAGAPLADFASSPKTVYIPDQEVFFRNLSENGVTFFWDFGDGNTSTEEEPQHAYIEEGIYDVSLTIANESGCQDSLFRDSEIIAVKGGNVSSPNAFTPSQFGPTGGEIGEGNGDVSRINDVFLPEFEGVVKFRMLIYNKWGELLFESKSVTKGWDGYFNGNLAPAGVYVYKLELGFNDGSTAIEVGDLTLIR